MLEVASLFTDGAVLCRDREIRVFGQAEDGQAVTVRLADCRGNLLAEAAADAAGGRFLACLPPQKAQTGCRLTVAAGGETFTAKDVAIGDVYLAGGQSNMELELRNAKGGAGLVPVDPLVRFFNVPRSAYVCEAQQKAVRETRWQPVTRETAGYNSAVASVFAARMRRKHPEIPVGIIGCYWGGTSVTCWMNGETLETLAEGRRYREEYARASAGVTMDAYLAAEAEANRKMDDWSRAAGEYQKEHPDASGEEINRVLGPFPWNPPAGPGSPFRPAGLAESMLKEVFPAALTAVLYYQGEEDTWRTEQYDLLMAAMIRFWRKGFRAPELPFLFVQLPMWLDYGAEDTRQWARTRLAQAAVRDAVRNTGMICLLDQGEYGNIHPVDKEPVGERLAELAGKMLYGEGEESPRVVERWISGDTLTVRLSGPVRISDGKAPALLEAAGADGNFRPAEGRIADDLMMIRAEGVDRPAQARYAWTDWSDAVNLFGENGLPAEPFLV